MNAITLSLSEADVHLALSTLDPEKAIGADNIRPMVLKSCATILSKPLHHLYLMSLRYATIPHCWKIHKVTPIFKSGNRNPVKCYIQTYHSVIVLEIRLCNPKASAHVAVRPSVLVTVQC